VLRELRSAELVPLYQHRSRPVAAPGRRPTRPNPTRPGATTSPRFRPPRAPTTSPRCSTHAPARSWAGTSARGHLRRRADRVREGPRRRGTARRRRPEPPGRGERPGDQDDLAGRPDSSSSISAWCRAPPVPGPPPTTRAVRARWPRLSASGVRGGHRLHDPDRGPVADRPVHRLLQQRQAPPEPGYVTPAERHEGRHTAILEARKKGMKRAREARAAANGQAPHLGPRRQRVSGGFPGAGFSPVEPEGSYWAVFVIEMEGAGRTRRLQWTGRQTWACHQPSR
jgi:hypothetical protein